MFQELTALIARTGYGKAIGSKAYVRNFLESQDEFENWTIVFGILFEHFEALIEADMETLDDLFWQAQELRFEVDRHYI